MYTYLTYFICNRYRSSDLLCKVFNHTVYQFSFFFFFFFFFFVCLFVCFFYSASKRHHEPKFRHSVCFFFKFSNELLNSLICKNKIWKSKKKIVSYNSQTKLQLISSWQLSKDELRWATVWNLSMFLFFMYTIKYNELVFCPENQETGCLRTCRSLNLCQTIR